MALSNLVLAAKSLLDGQIGQIADVDRLQPVVAVSENAQHGQLAEHPGDVVDQNVLRSPNNTAGRRMA